MFQSPGNTKFWKNSDFDDAKCFHGNNQVFYIKFSPQNNRKKLNRHAPYKKYDLTLQTFIKVFIYYELSIFVAKK